MTQWRSCQHLWKHDLGKITDSLKDKAPSHAKFEEKLTSYHKAAQRILDEAKEVELDWILVDTRPLAQAVHREALELTAAVSAAMRDLDMQRLAQEEAAIVALREVINKEPDSLQVRCDAIERAPVRDLCTYLLCSFKSRLFDVVCS